MLRVENLMILTEHIKQDSSQSNQVVNTDNNSMLILALIGGSFQHSTATVYTYTQLINKSKTMTA